MMQESDVQVDNLTKFGPAFQVKVLTNLINSAPFLQQSLDVLNPKFFDTDAGRWIVGTTIDYYQEYRTTPTLEVFKIELNKQTDEILKVAVKEQLRSVFQRKNDDDLEYVKNSFLEFAKQQALKTAIIKSVDLLQMGKYGDIKSLVDTALKAGQPRNIGHNWKEDFNIRLSGNARIVIPTGWPALDSLIGGGLGAGELGVFAAPPGIGKSWLLSTIGANAARAGRTVAHYTLELNENYVGLRYDTIYTGIESGKLIDNAQRVLETVESIPGNVIVKYYAARTITTNTIQAHFENLISSKIKPDIIIIDYADLMNSSTRLDNQYQEMGRVYEELRTMGAELKVPCWTASQTQRSSTQDDVIEADKIADSFQKIMTADLVVSLSRKLDDKKNHTGRAHVIKNRFGKDGVTFPMHMNTEIGKIEIFDEYSPDGETINRQMQSSHEEVKKALARKFNQLHGDLRDIG